MPMPERRIRDDSSVRDRVASLAQAIRDKDIDYLMTHYAPDVVAYDVMPPMAALRGRLSKEFRTMVCNYARAHRLRDE